MGGYARTILPNRLGGQIGGSEKSYKKVDNQSEEGMKDV